MTEPCRCLGCSTYLADGVPVVRADSVVVLIESIADSLHSITCVNCAWRALHTDAMALEAVAEALRLTDNPTERSTS